MKKILIIFQLVAVIYSMVSLADDDEGAKALFYDSSSIVHSSATSSSSEASSSDSSKPDRSKKGQHTKKHLSAPSHSPSPSAVQEYAGMKYWIELERNGKPMRVSPSFPFRSGDRFKVGVTTNHDGYLYLINVGTTGQAHLLYPPENGNDDGFIRGNTLYHFPLKGMMRFDDNPGVEQFKLALSPVPLTDTNSTQTVDSSNSPASNYDKISYSTGSSSCRGSKDILLDDACEEKGSKDIFVEDDTSGSPLNSDAHPASYAVAPASYLQQGNPILKTLKLKHK